MTPSIVLLIVAVMLLAYAGALVWRSRRPRTTITVSSALAFSQGDYATIDGVVFRVKSIRANTITIERQASGWWTL